MAHNREKNVRSGIGRAIGIFLLINMIPLGVGAWLLFRHLTGDLPDIELPAGTGQNLMLLAALLVLLVFVASLSLPATHRAVRGTERHLAYRKAILVGKWEGSRTLSCLALPPVACLWFLAATVRLILLMAAVALILLSVLFTVRLFEPELGQEWIGKALEWRPG